MLKKGKISVYQMFAMLIVSRVVIAITIGVNTGEIGYPGDFVISSIAVFPVILLMSVPFFVLYKRNNLLDINDFAIKNLGKFGLVFAALYCIYFIYSGVFSISVFNKYVTEAINPQVSVLFLSLGILAASCYGAFKGVEAIARTSGIIFVVTIAGLIFLFCTLFSEADLNNFRTPYYDGGKAAVDGGVFLLSRLTFIPLFAVVIPFIRGKAIKGFVTANAVNSIIIAVIVFFLTTVLGDYISTQSFPVHTLTRIAGFGILERLDGVYLGLWTACMFINISAVLFAFALCFGKIFGAKRGKAGIFIAGGIIAVFVNAGFIAEYSTDIIFSKNIMLWISVTACFILPLIILLAEVLRKKGIQ